MISGPTPDNSPVSGELFYPHCTDQETEAQEVCPWQLSYNRARTPMLSHILIHTPLRKYM